MQWLEKLKKGVVIPAHPLALTAGRKLDERRQRALTRYYKAAGSGGVAVGVHTTQFAIRDAKIGLYRPVLELAMEELRGSDLIKVAGVVGRTPQAVAEAEFARDCGYEVALLSLGAMRDASIDELLDHVRAVATVMPVFGFYLQPAVGGRLLPYEFWRGFAEIENVVAIKMAPFNRYQTLDVVRAVAESGRDVALYTGNDDNILVDLATTFRFGRNAARITGGLLGHWSVWTRRAVELLERAHSGPINADYLTLASQVTDSNAALFDPQNNFAGCIAGLHEVLRRQGLLEGIWCLDPNECLSPGQSEEIDRIYSIYPHLTDDQFVAEHRDAWLR
ncbi:MAG TPA: dihydrodipicolinate synthase family protein [Bryobacteraceae bacterium]|nr:dihydrodipicolinate synthase family protein [Bryobacteraceae bacterium]